MYLEFAQDLGWDGNVKRAVVSVDTRCLLASSANNTDITIECNAKC